MNLNHSFYTERKPESPNLRSLETCVTTRYKFEQGGLLVYDVKSTKSFKRSYPQSTPKSFLQYDNLGEYLLEIPEDEITLDFDGHFECGNLLKAVKLSDYEYDIYTRSDTKSPGHNHWYYFSVYNPRKTPISFNICNMRKPDKLYTLGMKPCIWSCKAKELENVDWQRSGSSISYTQNSNLSYTLKFTYNFKYASDTVFFAYCIPYTYSELNFYLSQLKSQYKQILRVNTLCFTNGAKEFKVITITESIRDYLDFDVEAKEIKEASRNLGKFKQPRPGALSRVDEKHANKKAVVLMARVHPGETVSSFMMQGAIDFLTSSHRNAAFLRKKFVFKIVPMLNPDGVCVGNYRCCLNGSDLNRKWKRPHKRTYPTIFYTKAMIFATAARHEVKMVCDFHGHTKKKSVFMYGCSVKPDSYDDIRNNLLTRIAPYYMYTHNRAFSFKSSHFRLEKYKSSTSRIVFFKELQLPHSYTMESSFFGADGSNSHFTPEDLKSLGRDLCRFCTVFAKDSLYLRLIADTNSYLRETKLKALLNNKNANKLAEEPLEVSKVQEIVEKIEEDRVEVREEDELLQIEEDNEEEVDIGGFWKQLEAFKCFPDDDSSGSDDDVVRKVKVVEEEEVSLCEQPLSMSMEVKMKSKVDHFVKKRHSNLPRNVNQLSMNVKKVNETVCLKTFKFPDAEFDRRSAMMFDFLKPSNQKLVKRRDSNSGSAEKKSLGFLPILSNITKSADRTLNLQYFTGFADNIKQIITQSGFPPSRR